MKITVGHILILGAIGGGLYASSGSSSNWIKDKSKLVANEIQSLTGLFKSGERETSRTSETNEPARPAISTVPVSLNKPTTAAKPKPPEPEPPTSTQKSKTIPAPPKVVDASVGKASQKNIRKKKTNKKKKVSRKKKRRVVKKKHPNSVRFSAKKKNTGTGKYIGSYVAMELSSGRVVKGILQSQTPTEYTLELPGMGPLKYSKDSVKSINPVN